MTSPRRDVFIGSPGCSAQPAFFSSTEAMFKIKTVLVGDVDVGKTSLALRFVRDKFEENYKPTIGASFISKTAIVEDGCVVNFQIWDTAGQERYKSLVPMYIRGARIAFIVYDVTSPESFANCAFWLDALQHHGDMITTVLVANKSDLESSVDESVAMQFAVEHGMQFVPTSAKSGENVDRLFQSVGLKVVQKLKRETRIPSVDDRMSAISIYKQEDNNDNDIDGDKQKRKRCC